jgi:hypothetical protein
MPNFGNLACLIYKLIPERSAGMKIRIGLICVLLFLLFGSSQPYAKVPVAAVLVWKCLIGFSIFS